MYSDGTLFFMEGSLDAVDRRILDLLQTDGRMSNADLARAIGLTPPPTLARVRRLEREGYLRGYAALVDRAKLGYSTLAFVSVELESHKKETSDRFRRACERIPQVLECHHIAGDEDFLLKVVAADAADYERFVLEILTRIPGIEKVKTIFVLSSAKSTTKIPVPTILSPVGRR